MNTQPPVPGAATAPSSVSALRSPVMMSGSTSSGGSVPVRRGLMSSVSPSSGGSGYFWERRGLISCLHSLNCRAKDSPLLPDQDLPEAIHELIVGFYEKAFDRLPCGTMPDLLRLLNAGGLCLGLLDPVSNIILNTLALLPKDAAAAASSPPATKRPKKSNRGVYAWHEVAARSYQSLLGFLMTYFGCLTKEQAIRYLYSADANLLVAVILVQIDLYMDDEEVDFPESERTHAALKWAADIAGHPLPSTLVQVMTIRLKRGDFDLLQHQFSRGTPLTAEDVQATHRILHMMMRPLCVANIAHNKEGLVLHVRQNLGAQWSEENKFDTTEDTKTVSTILSWDGIHIWSVQKSELPEKVKHCLRIADGQKHYLKTPCGDACDYLQSLKMFLHGVIHNFFIQAFKLLPTPSGSLMRSILKAGHCYGSMDPLSNIIVNSIWYNNYGRPLPESECVKMKQYNDIFDPLSLLRPVVRSLEGLTELALFADPQSSITCAMEKLCSAKCVVVGMLSSATERSDINPFNDAAMAARHPLPFQLGELHQLLLRMPDERGALLSTITYAQASGSVLLVDDIVSVLSTIHRFINTFIDVQAPRLSVKALRVVSSKRSEYEKDRSWFRSKIEQVLQDYTDRHFWGPNYKLDVILGVEESNQARPPFSDMRYQVNFTAISDLKLQRTLFFAELWFSPTPRPEFCCPLPYAYAGRCYYDVHTARKILYPDDAKYIPHDITEDGTGSVDDMLEMDLVYFSPELDVELAEKLKHIAQFRV